MQSPSYCPIPFCSSDALSLVLSSTLGSGDSLSFRTNVCFSSIEGLKLKPPSALFSCDTLSFILPNSFRSREALRFILRNTSCQSIHSSAPGLLKNSSALTPGLRPVSYRQERSVPAMHSWEQLIYFRRAFFCTLLGLSNRAKQTACTNDAFRISHAHRLASIAYRKSVTCFALLEGAFFLRDSVVSTSEIQCVSEGKHAM